MGSRLSSPSQHPANANPSGLTTEHHSSHGYQNNQSQHHFRTAHSSTSFLTPGSTSCFVRDGIVTSTDYHDVSSSSHPRSLSSSLNNANSDHHMIHGLKCPVCFKNVLSDDIDYHILMCLSKPSRLSYNEDVLTDNKGECVICLEDLLQGEIIARLPCLCIYHKCWFAAHQPPSCPEHPTA
ncbi:E3 ubiquitin-protein ligase ZNRF1 [Fragariocoptes setiger]|uniref:RING-type E3 ubiquitin transferase n=1 Tax=Fragariocoptes setiger TaxID=1670756 RepID=A0ABQ7S7G7_9ACAR|nr:E3 ubiquitin-protein ligase ZNRF1 [Fragariocoptes setiger]